MKPHERRSFVAAWLPHLKRAQDTGWLLLVLLVPLWLNLWGQRPFELPKITLMRSLVWLLAGLAAVEYLLGRRSLRRDLSANPLWGMAGLLALVIAATTATAVNWRLSLWGSYERGQGAVTLLTYLLLFLLAANQLRPWPRARRALAAMAAAAAPLVLLSLAQGAGWRPFGLVSDARSPLFATLGRANFLGAYLAILAPLTLAAALLARRRVWRLAWLALWAGELVVIGLTLARSAWLAAAVSLASFALLQWGGRLPRPWRVLSWGGVGLTFLAGPLAVFWLGQSQSGSAAARLLIWRGVAALVGQRPLLGYGADALGIVFPRVYPPELVYYQGRQFFVDRAHNLFLDWAAAAGLPGALAFFLLLGLFVIVAAQALRKPHPRPQRALLAAILAAVLGNTANNLTSFDATPAAAAFWLLLGAGAALSSPLPQPEETPAGGRPLWRWGAAGLLLLLIGAAIWQANGRPLLADVAARAAYRRGQAGEWGQAAAAAERATAYWPAEPAHYLLLGQIYWRQAAAEEPAAPVLLPRAAAALRQAQRLRPEDPMIWLRVAEFYTAVASPSEGETRRLAEAAYQQAIALAPNNAAIYAAWGRVLLAEGRPAEAAPLLRQAVRLDQSSGEAYLDLGAAELALGRAAVALADYREAVRLLPGSSRAYTGLARAYWQLGRSKEALQAAETALQYDPQNSEAREMRQQIVDLVLTLDLTEETKNER